MSAALPYTLRSNWLNRPECAEFYVCRLAGLLGCNFGTAYVQPNGVGTYTVLNPRLHSQKKKIDSLGDVQWI